MERTETQFENNQQQWQEYFERKLAGENAVSIPVDTDVRRPTQFERKGDLFLAIIKKLFLFLPGSILLYGASLVVFVAYFSGAWGLFQFGGVLTALGLYGFMVILGIGNIRNPKHIALPMPIVAIALVISYLSIFIGGAAYNQFLFTYAFYLLPLVFVAPLITKELIEMDKQQG